MRCCAGGGRLKECRPPPLACTSNSGAVRGNLMWLGCGDGLLQGPQSNLHWYSHVAAHSMTPRSLWHGRASPFGAVTHRTSGEGGYPCIAGMCGAACGAHGPWPGHGAGWLCCAQWPLPCIAQSPLLCSHSSLPLPFCQGCCKGGNFRA